MLMQTDAKTIGRRRRTEDEVEEIFSRLTGRWTLQILVALSLEEQRFSEIRRSIPRISANLLTVRLRELEATGLVCREMAKAPCSFPIYRLGPLALQLRPALEFLARWKGHIAVNDHWHVVPGGEQDYRGLPDSRMPSPRGAADQ